MKVYKKIRNICLMLFGLMLTAACGNVAFADQAPDYQIGITPTQNVIGRLMPGETYEGTLTVKNTGKRDFDFGISFAPYSVSDNSYDPSFTAETQYSDMQKWINVDVDSGSLSAGEGQEINYTISVPNDAHGGAQMIAILATMNVPSDSQDSTAVETVRQLAFVILGNVDGDVIETGKVLENKVPGFLFNPPILGSSTVENTGNVYTVATYKLQVFPLFSDEEVYTNEENPENNIIFPETKRYNEIKWEGSPHLGIFRVRQTVKIFDEESVTEKIVFLCPIWFLFIVILLIFLIIFWIVSRIIKRKREA